MKKRIVLAFITIGIIMSVLIMLVVLNKKKDNSEEADIESTYVDGTTEQGTAASDTVLLIEDDKYFKKVRAVKDGIEIALKEPLTNDYILKIPSVLDGETVKAFQNIENDNYIKEVYISDGVEIGIIANCDNLTQISFGKVGIDQIIKKDDGSIDFSKMPYYATLHDLKKLSSIVFADDEDFAKLITWSNLPELKTIEFPGKIVSFESILCGEKGLTQLVLPSETNNVSWSFSSLSTLTYVKCNDKLETIDVSFNKNASLQYVIIPSMNTEIKNSFTQCPNLKLVVKKGSKAEEYAKENIIEYVYIDQFDEKELENLKIYEDDDVSFEDAGTISDEMIKNAVHISGEEYFKLEKGNYGGYGNFQEALIFKGGIKEPFVLELPETYNGEKVEYVGQIENNNYLVGVIIPNEVNFAGVFECDNIRSIKWGRYAGSVSYCKNMTSIDYSNVDYTGIFDGNLSGPIGCPKLTNIIMPDKVNASEGVFTIEGFLQCNIKSLKIPEGVTSATFCVFKTEGIEEVIIPKSMKEIMSSFEECESLKDVYIYSKDLIYNPGCGAFENCPNVTLHVYEGSTSEAYAKKFKIKYIYIDEE